MTPGHLLRAIVRPTLSAMGSRYRSPEAEAMLLAIAGQESGLRHRVQVNAAGKPLAHLARGLWQFERGGGVRGVMRHSATKEACEAAAKTLLYRFDEAELHRAIADNDGLACTLARLLLWTHPRRLPGFEQAEEAWAQYLAVWRPGKPHAARWPGNWSRAVAAVQAEE